MAAQAVVAAGFGLESLIYPRVVRVAAFDPAFLLSTGGSERRDLGMSSIRRGFLSDAHRRRKSMGTAPALTVTVRFRSASSPRGTGWG